MAKQIELRFGGAVIVDDDDYPALSQYQWYRTGRDKRYVIRMADDGRTWIVMARVVSGAKKGQYVAWRNGNSLDCRKENIFVGTASEARSVSRGGDGTPITTKRADLRATRPQRLAQRRLEKFQLNIKVGQTDECWEWQGCLDPQGYGRISWHSRTKDRNYSEYAHRIAWVIANGCEIPSGKVIRHTCDNPRCCNPAHLVIGTQFDNVQDRQTRHRHRATSRRGITDQIITMRRDGMTWASIRDALGCSYNTVGVTLRNAGMTKGARNG